jgi:hypothetical protein
MSEELSLSDFSHPVDAERVRHIPLEQLPVCIRYAEDARDKAHAEWFTALQNYNQRKLTLTVYYHEELKRGFMAAEAKAETDEPVIEAGAYSIACRNRRLALEATVGQLKREFKVKLLVARQARRAQAAALRPRKRWRF